MEDLSMILWRERELLETLLYKLEIEKLVLSGGKATWLGTAAREVEVVVEQLRETELLRAVVADEVAARTGLAANPSLRALAEAVDEPWKSILLEHREAFLNYTRQLTDLAAANRELLTLGQQVARDNFLGLTEGPSSYAPDGTAVTAPAAARRLLDRSI